MYGDAIQYPAKIGSTTIDVIHDYFAGKTPPPLVKIGVGTSRTPTHNRRRKRVAPLLEMRGIGKSFPGVRALSDVSLTLRAGEVLVLVGENGAGQIDADEDSGRRAASRRGRDLHRRHAACASTRRKRRSVSASG